MKLKYRIIIIIIIIIFVFSAKVKALDINQMKGTYISAQTPDI